MIINVTERNFILQKEIFKPNFLFLKDDDQENFDLNKTLWENEDG